MLQLWHIPPKRTISPAPVSAIGFTKAEYGKEQVEHSKPTTYDPRHPSDRTLNSGQLDVLLEKLKSACPDSGLHRVAQTTQHLVVMRAIQKLYI